MAQYLLVRPDDHVILGCDLAGCVLTSGSGGAPATVSVPVSSPPGGASLTVTFPPQHVAEQVQNDRDEAAPRSGIWQTALAGSSRIAVALPPGASVPFTVSGLLTALGRFPVVSDGTSAPGKTAIEAPWRLVTAPRPAVAGGTLQATHRPLPLARGGVTGLWRTSIGSTQAASGLRLAPADTRAAAAADPLPVSLAQIDRRQLVREAATQPISADRLELSTLGGWMHAWGTWPSFSWNHELHQGRDVRVRIATQGTLYPTGHRATFVEYVERIVSTGLGDVAVLQRVQTILIDAPFAAVPGDQAVTRRFPFDGVELLDPRVPADLGTGPQHGWQQAGQALFFWPLVPGSPDGQKVQFSARLTAAGQAPVTVRLPLMFVTDLPPPAPAAPGPSSVAFAAAAAPAWPADPQTLVQLVSRYGLQQCDTASQMIDLIRSAAPEPGDRHELHALVIAANDASASVAPVLTSMQVAVPALRGLLGSDAISTARFTADYLSRGAAADVILALDTTVGIDFTNASNLSGGLVAPKYKADALSRTAGPVVSQAVQALATGGPIDPAALFQPGATLLGFALPDLVKELQQPPQIVPGIDAHGRPTATMTWTKVKLRPFRCFVADDSSQLDVTVTVTADGTDVCCSVSKVGLQLPPSDPLLTLTFDAITFTQHDGKLPAVSIDGLSAKFTGDLSLLQDLEDAVKLSAVSPYFDITPAGIVAHYSVPVPEIAAGAFVLRDAVFSARLDVPFGGGPLELTLAFSSMANPFELTVMMFGGGGYVEMAITHEGLKHFEIALQFGALIAIDFGIASAEVHAFGGVMFTLADDGSVGLTGYIRIGGSVNILGLVSVSVEMCIQLSYQSRTNALVGRATMVIDIDLTLWSDSVELDTGEWVLAGHAPPPGAAPGPQLAAGFIASHAAASRPLTADEGLAHWRDYRRKFASA
jgi:hypothetical protein